MDSIDVYRGYQEGQLRILDHLIRICVCRFAFIASYLVYASPPATTPSNLRRFHGHFRPASGSIGTSPYQPPCVRCIVYSPFCNTSENLGFLWPRLAKVLDRWRQWVVPLSTLSALAQNSPSTSLRDSHISRSHQFHAALPSMPPPPHIKPENVLKVSFIILHERMIC
jgi:hypothetical protein